jgi:Permuted papain-like amidase enzyme, YaeF/YiiX, C92 family
VKYTYYIIGSFDKVLIDEHRVVAMKSPGAAELMTANYRLGNLEPGDILLSTDPDSFQSMAIRTATRSPFSHASIYDGNLNFYEAIGHGVVNFNYLRFGIHSKDNVRVLRLKQNIPNSSNIARSAAVAAEKYREREYWTPGAVATLFKLSIPNQEGRLFCSFLVAQSYEDAGFRLCKTLNSHQVHPGDILRADNLEDLTDDLVIRLEDWDKRPCLIDVPSPVDSECRDTPSIQLTYARSMMLREIRPWFENRGLPPPPTLDAALIYLIGDKITERQADLDVTLAAILEKHKYPTLPNFRLDRTFDDDLETWKQVPISVIEDSIKLHERLRRKWIDRAKGWSVQGQQMHIAFQRSGLRCLQLHQAHCIASAKVAEDGVRSIELYIRELERFVGKNLHD